MTRLRILSFFSLATGLLLALVVVVAGSVATVQAQGGDGGKERPGGDTMPIPDRLAAPFMPEHPTQADLGANTYYLYCMACHGDRGQGLTDEWRSAWSVGDQNCWQSKCHAANHPTEGFRLPYIVPPVIGHGILDRYQTAGNLHTYISTRMPWHMPGSLEEDQYWQLTAFLARANDLLPGEVSLTPANAASLRLGAAQEAVAVPATTFAVPQLPRQWLGGFLLIAASLLLVVALISGVLTSRKRR